MHYVRARVEKDLQEQTKYIYITDALKALTTNTARPHGGTEMTKRWVELIKREPIDTRTGDEIALDVMAKAGLRFSTDSGAKGGE